MEQAAVEQLIQPIKDELERLKEDKATMEATMGGHITRLQEELQEQKNSVTGNTSGLDTESAEEDDTSKQDSKPKHKSHSIPKIRSFCNGENFNRFCNRFREHVLYNNIQDPNLYLYFLNSLDEITYDKLRKVVLEKKEQDNCDEFCKKYQETYYPKGQKSSLRNEMINVKQQTNETIEDFSFRVSELGLTAYGDDQAFEPACITAFIQGVTDAKIKYELLKDKSDKYDEIVNNAKQLETISKIQATDETGIASQFNLLAVGREQGSTTTSKPKRDIATVQCYTCNQYGHYSNRCPNRPAMPANYNQGGYYNMPPTAIPNQGTPFQQRHPPTQPQNNPQQPAQPKSCEFCRTTTHNTIDCWSKNNPRRNFQTGAGSSGNPTSPSTNVQSM